MTDKIALLFIEAQLFYNSYFNVLEKLFPGQTYTGLKINTISCIMAGLGIGDNDQKLINETLDTETYSKDAPKEILLKILNIAKNDIIKSKQEPATKELIIELLTHALLADMVNRSVISLGDNPEVRPLILGGILELCGIKDKRKVHKLTKEFKMLSKECKTKEKAFVLAKLFYISIENIN